MNTKSEILDRIGLNIQNLDFGYLIIAMAIVILILLISIIIMIIQICKVGRMNKRLNKFMLGKDAQSLEDDIVNIMEDNKFLREKEEEHKKEIRTIFKNMERTFQKRGVVKYDAFNQMGGQLSFSLALLDENNNGFIINSVHSTDGCYSYTKEIKAGECSLDLGEEEKEALDIAMNEK